MQPLYHWFQKSFLKSLLRFVFAACLASPVYASDLKSVYEVELPIQNASGVFDQATLMTEAFKDVLVQVSGTTQVLNKTPIAAAVSQADKYVTRFSYHEHPERLPKERFIKVRFNEKLIHQLCAAAKQPIWPKKRPAVLLWIVEERNHTVSWLGDDALPLTYALEKALSKRSIPFVWPLLDLTDTALVSEQTVWTQALDSLEAASTRYNPDCILVGRLKNNGSWEGEWRLLKEGDRVAFSTKATDLNVFADQIAENLSSKLLAYTLPTEAQIESLQDINTTGKITLTIFGITDAEHYSKAVDYLRQLPSVKGVEVIQVISDQAVFELKTPVSQATIAQSISEGRFLIEHTTFHIGTALAYTLADAH